jgi:hypothetical protein
VKGWLVATGAAVLGVVAHHVVASYLVEERIAGVLLSAGAGGRPADAAIALSFACLRVVGFPLLLALVASAGVAAISAAFNRRSPSRSVTRGSHERAPR